VGRRRVRRRRGTRRVVRVVVGGEGSSGKGEEGSSFGEGGIEVEDEVRVMEEFICGFVGCEQ